MAIDNIDKIKCENCGSEFSKDDLQRSCSNCFACTSCEIYICYHCKHEIVVKPIQKMKSTKTNPDVSV